VDCAKPKAIGLEGRAEFPCRVTQRAANKSEETKTVHARRTTNRSQPNRTNAKRNSSPGAAASQGQLEELSLACEWVV
jgi:hypothetical protein